MCDTFVALPPTSGDSFIIFGKNSDREANEMQALEYQPPREHPSGSQLNCTYIQIPQVAETYAVLLGRPYWMWGAEFGVNEYGLAIGNEAVWTKMPIRRKGGLTGMDLLRLALERAQTARQGIEVITTLLADYGQGGICGLYDRSMAYHNSYILADTNEAWVLETADYLWAARRVSHHYAISNGLTIGASYDLSHKDLIPYAQKKGWLKKGKDFHFADCYSDWLYTTFSAQKRRRHQVDCFIRDHKKMDLETAMNLLQSHPSEDYRPDHSLLGNSICAHAANPLTRNATQTTGSIVCRLSKDDGQYWFTATSSPCLSVFKPVTFDEKPLAKLGPPIATFHNESFWWRHERLYRLVLEDFRHRKSLIEPTRKAFQAELIRDANAVHPQQLPALSTASIDRHSQFIAQWTESVSREPLNGKSSFLFRRYWKGMNRKVGL